MSHLDANAGHSASGHGHADVIHPAVLPLDEHNIKLRDNVHPPDWVNPKPADSYNIVVIGGGTAGLITALGSAGIGAKVALVERHLLGGDCLNVGCVPSKCLIRPARLISEIHNSKHLGIDVTENSARANFGAVMERMRRLRAGISPHDSARRLTEAGIDVFLGEARFTGDGHVEVDGKRLPYKKAVIASGARAVEPKVEGLKEAGFYTNETIFSLTEQPKRLIVIGGGPIGCELAQAFCRMGSEVTLLDRGSQFLPREDPDAAAVLFESFKRDGLRVVFKASTKKVTTSGDEKHLTVDVDGKEEQFVADAILVGAGRAPNVDGLNLEGVGVEYDARRGVKVNDRMQTTNSNIYAAGDICLAYKFTHTADATARIVIQNALFFGRKKQSDLVVPWCTYTEPEIAHVGMYPRDAKAKGIEIDTFKTEFSGVDRSIADGETEGFVKIHVRKGTDEILGSTIVGFGAGDMISEVTVAIVNKIGLGKIANVIHPYPTKAEGIKKTADAYNRTRLTPFAQKILGGWLKFIR